MNYNKGQGMNQFKIGDKVRKIHLFDGTPLAGRPIGPVLSIVDIRDHRPIDAQGEDDAIVILSDDSWEFYWNLKRV